MAGALKLSELAALRRYEAKSQMRSSVSFGNSDCNTVGAQFIMGARQQSANQWIREHTSSFRAGLDSIRFEHALDCRAKHRAWPVCAPH